MGTIFLNLNVDPRTSPSGPGLIPLSPKIQPELVQAENVRAPLAYRRFSELAHKQDFRRELRLSLHREWEQAFGYEAATRLSSAFAALAEEIQASGAAVFARLLPEETMRALIHEYDLIMRERGSESLLHSYANVGGDIKLLRYRLRQALHPLLLTLVADAAGGAISLVDARAKDTGPFEARAQDNMLHIDNTPFNDEYKLLWLWRKGVPEGPAGQNFTFLPGTNRLVRNCLITDAGEPYSTENASIFITEETLSAVTRLQRALLGSETAKVVEVQDHEPIAVAFAAGSLVHHRYRTATGLERSCLIFAFHRSIGISAPLFSPAPPGADLFDRALGGPLADDHDQEFLEAARSEAGTIAATLNEISCGRGTRHVSQQPISLTEEGMKRWFHVVTQAPEVEDIKYSRSTRVMDTPIDVSSLPRVLARELMFFDKHGPLDLILYADSREEIRKTARNRIREMAVADMERRLIKWSSFVQQPSVTDLLGRDDLKAIAVDIADKAGPQRLHQNCPGRLLLSLERLSLDLAEAICRPYSLQNFLSTSLFIFWALDELVELEAADFDDVTIAGRRTLQHYLALAALMARHDGARSASTQSA